MKGILILFTYIVFTLSTCPYDSFTASGQISCNNPKYMVDSKICAYECPSGFIQDPVTCPTCYSCSKPSGNAAILFTLNFFSVKDLSYNQIEDSDSASIFLNPGGILYNDLSQNSPLPTLDRGFYFAATSGIFMNKAFIPGIYFILNLWIKTLADGEILNVQISPNTYIRIWADSGVYKLNALINDSSGFQVPVSGFSIISYSSSWHYTSIYLNQISCDSGSINFDINGNSAGTTTLSSSEISFPSGVYTWAIGKVSGGHSFRGFIYWLQVRADNDASYPTVAPSVDCNDSQYWNGAECKDCSSCPNWPWCIRGNDCKICYSEDCIFCTGYASDMCTSCSTGILPRCCDHLGTACTQTWSNTACSTGFSNEGVCLYGIPYGWYDSGGSTCCTVLTADFNVAFAGIYASTLITGYDSSSYNFWNSPETYDPFPAKNRGLYFNSNQFLTGSINLSNTWSMGMWVYAISGTIISHSTNKLSISSTGYLSIDLESYDGASVSLGLWNWDMEPELWTYISYSVGFANTSTRVASYCNTALQDQIGYFNHVFRLADNEKLYIGKGAQNFKGFISYFQLWGTAITDFSASYNLYGFTSGAVSTLWPCDYSHYYDGSQCQPCLVGFTMGCTRSRAYSICDDILCSNCSSFLPNTCISCASHASGTPCKCIDGYYQYQDTCNLCNTRCLTCASQLDSSCMSCHPGFFAFGGSLCLFNCPTGFIEISATNSCIFSSNIGLSLNFYDEIKLNSVSGVQVGPSNNIYPIYETGDPYPQYLQGYYFKPDSYMLTNTVIGPYFTISIWIYSISVTGSIVTKNVSGTNIFCLELIGGSPKLSVILSDNSAFSITSSANALTNSWNSIVFIGYMDFRHTITISSYFNLIATESGYSSTQAYLQDLLAGTLYIGQNTAVASGFEGFLYNIKIFNSQYMQTSDYATSICASPCTLCPIDHFCPTNCPFLSFFNGSLCESCDGSCTNGCRYSSSVGTCTLCKTPQCYQCDTFSGTCTSCVLNAESDGSGGCKCSTSMFWKSGSCILCDGLCSVCKGTTIFECSICGGGNQLVNDICLYGCPYGYGASCAVVSNLVIDQLLDLDFQGSYGIFITGSLSSKYQPFVSPETEDPIPAYSRGLYFDGTMYLTSSSVFFLSHSFTIGSWNFVINDGTIIYKDLLQIDSKGSITAGNMEDNIPSTPYVNSLLQSSSLIGWTYLSVVVAYMSGGSVFEIYINGNIVNSVNVVNRVFRERNSSSLRLGMDLSAGFVGFIYYFQLWNVRITNFSTILAGFTFCGSELQASSLSSCIISAYKNEATCSACNSLCSKGCVRGNSCNICYDLLCLVCTGFGAGKCTQCVANANLVSGSCFCNPSFGISNDGLSCVACPSECSLCTISVYNKCTACVSGFFLFDGTGQCLSECPSGYTKNLATNKCDYLSNLGVSLDLTDLIRLDTVSGFTVGHDNANTYPNWSDANDPIPSYKRGYYFKNSNYLASTVMIAPSFTISIWTKPLASGILLTKYTSSDILKIAIDPSGYPFLSIRFSDSITSTITTSTSILNSWHFLSFTNEVQSDGKTGLTIYINSVPVYNIATASLIYFKDTISGTLYVGNDENFGTSGLYGFLAQLMIYNSYNRQADDYATSSCWISCSICPANHQCLSECDFDKYPDSCTACSSCSQGCVSSFTCGLCRDKECYSCTTFSGECIDCIANAEKSAGHCKCLSNAIWVSNSKSCELCDSICASCSTLKFNGCISCIPGYYLTQSLCISFCPTGYILNGNNCNIDAAYSNSLVFNLMPHQIKDIVIDLASNITVLTGKNNKFYPIYDATDPIATIYRGYYFTGSSYMQLPPYPGTVLPLITFAPKFVISAWIKPISKNGVIFSKQLNTGDFTKYISLELLNKDPTLILTLRDSTTVTYTSTNPLLQVTLSQWNFVLGTSNISPTPQQIMRLSTNSYVDISSDVHTSWLNDLEDSILLTIGACYHSSMALASFFNGFIWDLKIYNGLVPVGSLTSSICNGCSLCPIDNFNTCLDDCNIDSYWNGSSCTACSSRCSNKGCARSDKNCNLCQDILCEICDDYVGTCIDCKANASFAGTTCRCNSGYYWNNIYESCEICNSDDCLTCNLGYNSTTPCSSDTFSANLTVMADNSLCLVFSEILAKNLTVDDFAIVIEKQGKVSCKIEKVNSTCYYISLNFKKPISKGTLANFKFLNPNEVRSISEGILITSNFTVKLNFYDPAPYNPTTASVASQATVLSQTSVAGVLILSLVSSHPSSLWSIINTLQILSYLTLSGIPFSTQIRAFLNNLNSFNLFPNLLSYFIDKSEGNAPYSEAVTFGFETDLILINQGNDFSLILISIVSLPIVLYFSQCSNRWIGNKLKKTLKSYHFAFYLRFWIQCYLELGAAASIGIIDIEFRNATQIVNFIICAAVFIFLIITPCIYFWFSYKNKNRILSREKAFLAVFNPFFYEFKADRTFFTTQYYFVFFVRRLIYIINLVYLRNYPQTEVTVNIVLSLMTIMHLLFYWPFKDQILQYSNLVVEVLICWVMSLTVIYLFDVDSNVISKIEESIVLIVIIIIGIQLLSSIAIFGRTLYEFVNDKLNKTQDSATETLHTEYQQAENQKILRKIIK